MTDTGLIARVEDGIPAHYFDCERFNVTGYGLFQGKCDCTATKDVERLVELIRDMGVRLARTQMYIDDLAGGSLDSTTRLALDAVKRSLMTPVVVTPSQADRQPHPSGLGSSAQSAAADT